MTISLAATPKPAPSLRLCLREIPMQQGWTAAVLETPYPADAHYASTVTALLTRLPAFRLPRPGELFLQFDRCKPDREVPILRENARRWQPEIGLGVWLDREPPVMWTPDEFVAAAPGTLRPLMHHLFRLQTDAIVQAEAWKRLLGSGVLLRVATTQPDLFLKGTTEFLQPRIAEASLTGFPFYAPLLTAAALTQPDASYAVSFDAWLPGVEGYLRESEEDGGLLILTRQPSAAFWRSLGQDDFGIEGVPLSVRSADSDL